MPKIGARLNLVYEALNSLNLVSSTGVILCSYNKKAPQKDFTLHLEWQARSKLSISVEWSWIKESNKDNDSSSLMRSIVVHQGRYSALMRYWKTIKLRYTRPKSTSQSPSIGLFIESLRVWNGHLHPLTSAKATTYDHPAINTNNKPAGQSTQNILEWRT